jgi:hypothetical protein
MSFVFNEQIIIEIINALTKSTEDVKKIIDEIPPIHINARVNKYEGSTIISALIKRNYKPQWFPDREKMKSWLQIDELLFTPRVDISIAIELLIDNGADVNAKDDRRETPLHVLLNNLYHQTDLRYGRKGENIYKIEKLLIDNGASLDTPNKFGLYPLDYAINYSNNVDEIYILIKNGASSEKNYLNVGHFSNISMDKRYKIIELFNVRNEMDQWWRLIYEGKFKIFEDKEKEYAGESKAHILKAYKRFLQRILSLFACGIPNHKMIFLDFENMSDMCQTIFDEQLIYVGSETDFMPPYDYENWKPSQKLIKELTIKENKMKAIKETDRIQLENKKEAEKEAERLRLENEKEAERLRLENEKEAERLRLQDLMVPNNESSLGSVPERRSKHGFDFVDGGYKNTKKKKKYKKYRKTIKYRKSIKHRKYRKSIK